MMLIVLLNMVSQIAIFASEQKSTIRNGIYVIESLVGKGKVLDICGGEKADGVKLHIWDKTEKLGSSLNQLFYIDKNEDGSYVIMPLNSEMFLGVKEEENKEVKQYNPSFKDNFRWEINEKSNGEYELKLKSNGLNLDVCEGKNENGTKLRLWESNNTKAQRFRLYELDIKDKKLIDGIHKVVDVRRDESKLKKISLEGETGKITKYMVSHFEGLEMVYIPLEVSEIEEGAFSDCKSIEAVLCDPKMLKGFDKSGIKTVVVPDGVKTLEKKDFQGLKNLKNIKLPESIEEIEEGTFENFKNIKGLCCNPKWFKCFNRAKVEELEKLKLEIIKSKGMENPEDIQHQIECYKEKIKILKDKLNQLGVKLDEITTKNNEKLSGAELLKKLKDKTESLTKKYIDKSVETDRKLYEELIEDNVKTIEKNNNYKTEELSFEEKGNSGSQTTVEEIVKFDGNNKKYAKYAKEILQNLENGIESKNGFRKKSLDSISKEINDILKKIKDTYGITPYPVQVMTALRLSDEILNGRNTIAEVKTGEGKSYIIAVLALVLSKYGHKVDIVTSTEELARRDNENQKKYYELFGVKSGVLKKGSEESNDAQNEFNLEVLEREIVYSTNSNFEFVHLGSVFKKEPDRKRKYDVVIVDEVDNMLLDQSSMPAIMSEMITIKNRSEIFEDIYNSREKEESKIINGIKKYFAKKEVPLETIKEVILSAKMTDKLEKDKDYVVKGNEVIIIDPSTGYKKPGSRWSNYIHEMLELKEGIKIKETSVSNSMITQKSYFRMYDHITGLTGTVGNEKDKEILEETYSVKTFKMPRNKVSKQKVEYVKREKEVYNQIKKEIELKQKEKMPILVILPTNAMVNEFASKYFPNSKKITGVELEEDREAIKDAGKTGRVTIATNAAGRGIDI